VRQLVEGDPYWQNGIWTAYEVYAWNQCFEEVSGFSRSSPLLATIPIRIASFGVIAQGTIPPGGVPHNLVQ
jgi:hypothetical protein